jgi:hypothetical protein
MRRHSEQLQAVATSGFDGKVIRTAPQWHEPVYIGALLIQWWNCSGGGSDA